MTDFPFLWDLKNEVDSAAEFLLQTSEFSYLNGVFDERNHPKYTRLSYILSSEENQVLIKVIEKISSET